MTDRDLDQECQILGKLARIGKLKTLLLQKQLDKTENCGPKPCSVVLYTSYPAEDGIGIKPIYTGDHGQRIAGKGNRRFRCGTQHQQCSDCRIREQRQQAINSLKNKLNYQF